MPYDKWEFILSFLVQQIPTEHLLYYLLRTGVGPREAAAEQ